MRITAILLYHPRMNGLERAVKILHIIIWLTHSKYYLDDRQRILKLSRSQREAYFNMIAIASRNFKR